MPDPPRKGEARISPIAATGNRVECAVELAGRTHDFWFRPRHRSPARRMRSWL